MQIVFSNRAYLAIISETYEKIKTETGGIFLGCYEDGTWYVIEAIDPGPKSVFQVAYFEYDKKYTTHLINKLARLYHSKLTLIGLWHRHPGSFDEFSSTDGGTNSEYAKLSVNGAISVLVNIDPKFRITPYHVSWPLRYSKISYKVGDDFIPEQLLQLKKADLSVDYINSYAEKSHTGKISSIKPKVDLVRLIEGIKTQFKVISLTNEDIRPEEAEKFRDLLIDSLLDDITYLSEVRGLSLNIENNNGFLCISHKGADNTITRINFMYIPNKEQIIFSYGDICYLYTTKMYSSLLADYNPVDISFKSGLLRAMGFGKILQE